MSRRRALVLGGTGMLAGCVAGLLADGWHVVTPARRHREIRAEPETSTEPPRPGAAARAALGLPGQVPMAPTASTGRRQDPARARWVHADWAEPDALATAAGEALGGPADLLVASVPGSHRTAVLHAVAPLLAEGAPVVVVRGSDEPSTRESVPRSHPTHHAVLGLGHGAGVSRWLTHAEISDGVLAVVRRALAGEPPDSHQIGEPGPWRR
ncbi:Rossmann-fold NAD(P)-binding domain-containing protein [Streptoalloteichus hindustanus]|uniref:Uncharacterized protein n=1 Tax=Streptoalloteichus hindustanus TaxID=2017 RepID=A0A1M4XU57_STRHI|nr:hypothetical protein [Streptoalloteichus hindustanus]SHE97117.1 hypothetical protein SAMN05444320_102128 [Streptoalloteichus hindustanus]